MMAVFNIANPMRSETQAPASIGASVELCLLFRYVSYFFFVPKGDQHCGKTE
jgi:hypothetical protein